MEYRLGRDRCYSRWMFPIENWTPELAAKTLRKSHLERLSSNSYACNDSEFVRDRAQAAISV